MTIFADLVLQACIILVTPGCCTPVPNLSLTQDYAIDYRHNGRHTVRQSFFTTLPSFGTYYRAGLNYNF